MSEPKLSRQQIAKILERHKGSKAELARRASVKPNTVSMYLSGAPSENVDGHAQALARELVASEAALGEANGPSVRQMRNQQKTSKGGA